MLFHPDETIAALASAPGGAVRGILRVSGPETAEKLAVLFVDDDLSTGWQQSRLSIAIDGALQFPKLSIPLPARLMFWPGKQSYTGQPLVEIHTIGSPPLLEAAMSAILDMGVRSARPGEFTLRAFLAGRIDLVQAEAVLGVIDAHGHRQLETALKQLAGGISGEIADVRNDLLDLLADLEAGLDFVDEDIEFILQADVVAKLENAAGSLERILDQSDRRMQSTGRMRIVLAGLPNAGKSTLFNRLSGRDLALVSELQGTTRDYLKADLEIAGVEVELLDTAGVDAMADDLRMSSSGTSIDSRAQLQSSSQWESAQLILWCSAADLTATDRHTDAQMYAQAEGSGVPILRIWTKQDCVADDFLATSAVTVSAMNDDGIDDLKEEITHWISEQHQSRGLFVGTTAVRCRESLIQSLDGVRRATHTASTGMSDEFTALELRAAINQLGQILGTVYTDDILDRVFSKFCIGK